MKLKVFVMDGCPNCPEAKRIAKEVAEELGLSYVEVDIGTPDGQIEGLMLQIASTPSIALEDEVLVRGRVLPKEELMREVLRRLERRNDD